jgi:hypothetical protein
MTDKMLGDTRRGWKTKAQARCRAIVAATADGHAVTGAEDVEFLLWLLDRHPSAADKIGQGVTGFTVQTVEMGTRAFILHRVDGTSTDFSYYKCITAPDNIALVRKAMRRAVADQVIEFKQVSANVAPLVCAITGEPLSWESAHVDHASPVFIALADEWSSRLGGYSSIDLSSAVDGQIGRTLTIADAESWSVFHRANAHLRIVSRLANLSLLRTQR